LQGCRAGKEGEGGGARRRASVGGWGPADDARPRRGGERESAGEKKKRGREKGESDMWGCHIGDADVAPRRLKQPSKPLRG
jgi:hypothetical protein